MAIDSRIRVLSEEEIDRVHAATLEVLGEIGVQFKDNQVQQIMTDAGATIAGKDRVRIPAELIRDALETLPSEVVLQARDPKKNLLIDGKSTYYTNGFGAPNVIDLDNGHVRPATVEDLRAFTRLADYLSNVDYCLIEVVPQDLPAEQIDIELASIVLENTDKHVHISTYDDRMFDQVIELGMVASGDNAPAFSLGCCPISPLVYTRDATQRLIKAAKLKIPFLIVSGAIAGGTAPVTLAGTLVIQNAEILAGIVLSQLMSPGAPVLYGSFASPMNMRTGKQSIGTVEASLLNVATAQICRRNGIPFGYGTGGVSDTLSLSEQTGFEKALSVLFGTLAGSSVIHDAVSGLLSGATVASYEQIVLDNELCEIIRRLTRGFEVTEETLAIDMIRKVGPGGTYLTLPHTLRHFRKELYLSKIFTGNTPDPPSPFGEGLEIRRAREEAKRILDTHQPAPLSETQRREMQKILSFES